MYGVIERTINITRDFTKPDSILARAVNTIKQITAAIPAKIRIMIEKNKQKELETQKALEAKTNSSKSDSWFGMGM